MTNETLEEKSLWYKYKSEVWSKENGQTYGVHNIVRTVRSIHNLHGLAYISVPITSGKRLYDELRNTLIHPDKKLFLTGSASSVEKKQSAPIYGEIIKRVISSNYEKGFDFLKILEERLDKPILFPADLFIRGPKWVQDNFQALWTTLIGEKCSELHMCEDWEYSNGAVEEFTHAFQLRLGIPKGSFGPDESPFYNTKEKEDESRERMKNIKVYNHEGKPISIQDGIDSIDGAIQWIESNRFSTERMREASNLLKWTHEKIKEGFYQ